MAEIIHLDLPEKLKRHIDTHAGDVDPGGTREDYIRALIQRDMEDWQLVGGLTQSLGEARARQFAKESILDILNED